ncbi:thiamine pyrophosphate-binding protein [Bradyrhizobium zhanjiangense]|uniref:Thiamine pyrophosphate enzyme N-terminal TPP-binding domain-containing protein n=1 Tax=Bradyrhizobium zhanjiangense TaxID=1325107 RepID=A0A4Q0QZA0_9BRAD|nr:hypothetical protein EAS61_00935 [Bradyrhizobium zhanjiangense]
MSQTVSDFIVRRLHQWGVRHIFGYPGDGINGLFGAMSRAEGKMNFVQARLASDMPVVLEVKTDPEVPPLPPHITLQQAKNFSLALMKGDPNESGMIKGAARQVLESILPGKQ